MGFWSTLFGRGGAAPNAVKAISGGTLTRNNIGVTNGFGSNGQSGALAGSSGLTTKTVATARMLEASVAKQDKLLRTMDDTTLQQRALLKAYNRTLAKMGAAANTQAIAGQMSAWGKTLKEIMGVLSQRDILTMEEWANARQEAYSVKLGQQAERTAILEALTRAKEELETLEKLPGIPDSVLETYRTLVADAVDADTRASVKKMFSGTFLKASDRRKKILALRKIIETTTLQLNDLNKVKNISTIGRSLQTIGIHMTEIRAECQAIITATEKTKIIAINPQVDENLQKLAILSEANLANLAELLKIQSHIMHRIELSTPDAQRNSVRQGMAREINHQTQTIATMLQELNRPANEADANSDAA